MSRDYIHHLVPARFYHSQPASAPYLPAEFARDGFIHCTLEPEVLLQIANAIYRDAPGEFLVLIIDPARVTAPVKFEPPLPPPPPDAPLARHLFPHIYGPLNREAIVEIRFARRAPDGMFLEV
jgi:uncharacterized protein (DUF952 family)